MSGVGLEKMGRRGCGNSAYSLMWRLLLYLLLPMFSCGNRGKNKKDRVAQKGISEIVPSVRPAISFPPE